jgi:hypothetical protein
MNVLKLEPRRREVPTLRCAELRLSESGHAIELTVHDEAGGIAILEYSLVSLPPDFDLDRLRRAWDTWRGTPPALVS